jgi:hypothetical protein
MRRYAMCKQVLRAELQQRIPQHSSSHLYEHILARVDVDALQRHNSSNRNCNSCVSL